MAYEKNINTILHFSFKVFYYNGSSPFCKKSFYFYIVKDFFEKARSVAIIFITKIKFYAKIERE